MSDTSGVQPINPPPPPTNNDRRGDILAYASVGMLFYIVTLIFIVVAMKIEISAVMMTLVSVVVTAVTTGAALVLNFQFGSSKGSQAKDAQIAALTPSNSPQA